MKRAFLIFAAAVYCLTALAARSVAADEPPLDGAAVVARQTIVFAAPASRVPTRAMADGPLLGNGDLGVVLAGPPEDQQFHIGKNDFWRRNDASVEAVGRVSLSIPALQGASYRQEQDMSLAEVCGTFSKDRLKVQTRCWVDANENLLVTMVRCQGDKPIDVALRQVNGDHHDSDEKQAMSWFTRKADATPGGREAAVVSRIIGGTARVDADGGLLATLQPEQSLIAVTAVLSDLDATDPLAAAIQHVKALRPADLEGLSARHRAWWKNFWSKSFIEIPDKEIEKHWYAALYTLASCSRPGKVAPGLWGNWITTDRPRWHGDFHLNYNFQAPFYIVYSANHTDLSLPFYQAIDESIPSGLAMARRHGWKGVHFPVCIGPWGLSPEDRIGDWGQRSDAAFAALNFIWQYQYTQDRVFLRDTAYPFLIDVADFWQDYLKFENGRYVIRDDSIEEGSGRDFNPILSLGLVRTLFANLIPMSRDLGVDADRRPKWRDICDKISAFPLQEKDGKTIFRYSEEGRAWNKGNSLGVNHIFPAGAIGLDSDPKLLEICRNTIDVMHRWSDSNGFSSWYTACARVGYDPKIILARLRNECDKHSMPNLLLQYGGGGIENCGGFLAVNEMLLQSHDGVIRLFPDWPPDQDARFGGLRAVGAFLVSAQLKDGVVRNVKIVSEAGKPCTVVNPWPGRKVQLTRDRQPPQVMEGERLTFTTVCGEAVDLAGM